MKRLMTFAVLAVAASATSSAAMLDLAGTGMTVSDVTTLASYDGVTNSSATAATLTFNIADDQAYDMTIGGKVAVVKDGAGTLSLGKADRTFTGGTTVSQGKLVLATDNAKALGTGTVTVVDGATLDFNGAFSTANGTISSVYAEGTGVDGNGALVNTGAAHVNKYLTSSGALYLTGDLLVNNQSRLDLANIYPQGHTLRLKGTGTNGQTARVNKYYNPNGGDISIEYGTYLAYEATSFGNTADKSTVYLRGGVLSVWVDGDSYYDKSPLVVEQASTIQGLARNANRSIYFGKPVTLNAPLTFSRSSGTYLATIGFNNNDNALYGSAPITVGANVKFAYAIAYTSSKNKYSGPIIVNSSGTLAIGAGQRGALTSGSVTNNGTVAYNCTKNVTVSPREIIGGAFQLPTNLVPVSGQSVKLTVNGTVLSNMTTTIYRNALTLDGGAKVVGGKIYLAQSEGYAGTLTLKNCLVTNLADIAYVYRGALTLGNGARWVTPSRRIHLSQQTKWECTNTVATLNLEEGSDMTIHCLNCGQYGDYKYTNVVDGVEVVSPNVMTSIVNQAGGTFRTTGYYTAGEEDGIRLGHYTNARTTWNMTGGKLIVGEPYRLNMAIAGQSTFNMSGGEVFTTELDVSGRTSGTGFGIWNMTGGELNVGSNGIQKTSTKNVAYEINLGGGVVRASDARGFTSPLKMNLTGASGTNVTFDTQAAAVTLSGVLSGVGGLTKTGTGTLTLSGANTYAGATRLLDGTVAFTQAYPGGDLELPAAATGGTSAPLLTAPSFAFAAGKGVRVTEADALDASTFGPSKTLVSSTTALAALPSLTLVAADGTPLANDGKWYLYLTDGGKTLKFGPVRGTKILLR